MNKLQKELKDTFNQQKIGILDIGIYLDQLGKASFVQLD
jgi:hypothetical protein